MSCLRRAKVNVLVRRRFEIVQGTAHATALDDEEDMLEKTVEVEVVCCFISICRHLLLSNGSSRATCDVLHGSCYIWSALLLPNFAPPVPLSHTTTHNAVKPEADGGCDADGTSYRLEAISDTRYWLRLRG